MSEQQQEDLAQQLRIREFLDQTAKTVAENCGHIKTMRRDIREIKKNSDFTRKAVSMMMTFLEVRLNGGKHIDERT